MGKKYRRYKNAIEKYLASEKGQRFFHVAYSLGAAIVIIGALFKINHFRFGTELLIIGMLTEAFIFALSAFDTPSKDYKWEEVFPVLDGEKSKSEDEEERDVMQQGFNRANVVTGGAGGTVVIGGGKQTSATSSTTTNGTNLAQNGGGIVGSTIISGTIADGEEITSASEKYAEQLNKASENMEKFAEITNSLAQVSDLLLNSFKSITDNSTGLGNNTQGYIFQMEALNRNLAGLNTIYEVQLKGVSGQINTIEHINAGLDRIKNLYHGSLVDSSIFKNETEKMAHQLSELNRVYARLLQAMTVNMNMSMGGGFNTATSPTTPTQSTETGDKI